MSTHRFYVDREPKQTWDCKVFMVMITNTNIGIHTMDCCNFVCFIQEVRRWTEEETMKMEEEAAKRKEKIRGVQQQQEDNQRQQEV